MFARNVFKPVIVLLVIVGGCIDLVTGFGRDEWGLFHTGVYAGRPGCMLSRTMADTDTSASDVVAAVGKAYFMPDLSTRIMRMDFLELTYDGGLDYKHGVDGEGQPILIQHEGEYMGSPVQSQVIDLGRPAPDAMFVDRYTRRRRMAAYENQYRPIIDKFSAYLTQSAPKRGDTVVADAPRLKLDTFIRDLVESGLKLSEGWLGWDTVKLPTNANVTKREVTAVDPVNKGQPYLVSRKPQCVVDFSENDSRAITRVVFEEVEETKAGLTAAAECKTFYREWTDSEWILYEAVKKDKDPQGGESYFPTFVTSYGAPIEVREIERAPHGFGRCPWVRFCPKFPSEDLAELCRSLFNTSSLLDEEVYKNTFTQKYAIGVRSEDLVTAASGAGSWMAFPEPGTQVGVLGSIEGQAQVLMNRMEQIRDAIFSIVSLDHAKAVKAAAESAEKRKMDLENLYSALVKIVEEVERCENAILVGLGMASDENTESFSRYDRKFDVNTLQDLLDQLKAVAMVPFIPPAFRRRMAEAVMTKLDPFADPEEMSEEVETMIDITAATAQACDTLKTAGCLTGPLAVRVLGIPKEDEKEFLEGFDAHPPANAGAFGTELDQNGNPIDPNATPIDESENDAPIQPPDKSKPDPFPED